METLAYSIQIKDTETAIITKQDDNGLEVSRDVTLKELFESAQRLGFFSCGSYFQNHSCTVTFEHDGTGETSRKIALYSDMLNADVFGSDDLQEIIEEIFTLELFPVSIWYANPTTLKAERLRRVKHVCDTEAMKGYVGSSGQYNVIGDRIGAQWSEFQASQKRALEIVLVHLQGQEDFIKKEIAKL